jgi:hypothetical protein
VVTALFTLWVPTTPVNTAQVVRVGYRGGMASDGATRKPHQSGARGAVSARSCGTNRRASTSPATRGAR